MSVLQYILRLVMGVIRQPAVQDALSVAAREAMREASRRIIQEVENGFSRYEKNKSTPTVK